MVQETPRLEPVVAPLDRAGGLVLAERILADRDHPPFARAMMDGYACSLADAGRSVPCAAVVPAGHSPALSVAPGRCLEIMTGAACPPGTDAVVPKECVRPNRGLIGLPSKIELRQHIAELGSECVKGRLLLRVHDRLTPLAVATVATCGISAVQVFPRPTVAVVTTGAELVPPGEELEVGQIRDSNGPMLTAMAAVLGLTSVPRVHAEDTLAEIRGQLDRFASSDVILLTGGVSVGRYDLVPQALEGCGAEVVFHRVRQKPGKPLLFARRGRQLIFALPGNPLAAHLCFHRYVTAALRCLEGLPSHPVSATGRLLQPLRAKSGRTYFVLAHARRRPGLEGWWVKPAGSVSSADMFAACRANCYAEVGPGNSESPRGASVSFTWLAGSDLPDEIDTAVRLL